MNPKSKKSKHYELFDIKSSDAKIKLLSNRLDKLTFSIIMQMKFGHGFFKSYLFRLSNYESKNCNDNCSETQTSKHLLLDC